MAGITTKGAYGLSAMYVLARHYQQGVLKIAEIAELGGIPQNYLEQLLSTLRKEGLIESTRGMQGGYQLAKSPSEITVFSILHTLEGEFCITFSASNVVLNQMWKRTRKQIKEIFSETLQDLVDQGDALDEQSMYFI